MIDETVERIAARETHSSSDVALEAARALRELRDRDYPTVDEFLVSLDQNSDALRSANPYHATLRETQRRIVEEVTAADDDSVEAATDRLLSVVDRVVTEIETSTKRIADRAAALLADGETVLTHGYSSTVEATLDAATDSGRRLDLYVTESRPRYFGRRTARRLADRDEVSVTLVVDGAAGHVMGECDRVLLGMNCIGDGVLYNRVGTYPIAATAADRDVPVTVVGSASKLSQTGFGFENSLRPPWEVLSEPAEGFEVANPAYDETPTRLLDRVVTEEDTVRY